MAISSTENVQCGIFARALTIYISIGLNHVALPAKHYAHSSIFRNIFDNRIRARLGGGSDG
jgi:hypothetical protein